MDVKPERLFGNKPVASATGTVKKRPPPRRGDGVGSVTIFLRPSGANRLVGCFRWLTPPANFRRPFGPKTTIACMAKHLHNSAPFVSEMLRSALHDRAFWGQKCFAGRMTDCWGSGMLRKLGMSGLWQARPTLFPTSRGSRSPCNSPPDAESAARRTNGPRRSAVRECRP